MFALCSVNVKRHARVYCSRINRRSRCIIDPKSLDLEIVRELPAKSFRWPRAAEVRDDASLAGNHHYADLRGLTWDDYALLQGAERELLGRIEEGASEDQLLAELEEEAEQGEEHRLLWLDIGMAAPVAALSAIGCVPAYSCNGGVLGGHHRGDHPIVGFYARAWQAPTLLEAAEATQIGLRPWRDGIVLAYSDGIEPLQRFGAELKRRLGP